MARRTDLEKPFMDVQGDTTVFTLPLRKWRELLFIGAMIPDGDCFVRNPSRPLPAFREPDLFPADARFQVREEGKRVRIQRLDESLSRK